MVDYDNVKVGWSRYELENGITICLTALPLYIFSTDTIDPKGMPGYVITWNNAFRLTVPENLTGAPAPPLTPEQTKRAPSVIVRPLTFNEPWNEFELSDGHTLRSRVIVTEIRRVINAFDPSGIPVFPVVSQIVIDVSETHAATADE